LLCEGANELEADAAAWGACAQTDAIVGDA
jgi:hypothetical protein